MFILKAKAQLEKAIEKAGKIKPIVRMIKFGVYAVKGTNNTYTVKLEIKDDEKRVICECKAGERGIPCYHSASALELHGTVVKYQQLTLVR